MNDGAANSNVVSRNITLTAVNDPPVATNATITGPHNPFRTRDLLTAHYTYYDPESDPPGIPTYRWYTATNSSGAGRSQITGAVSDTFTTRFADGGLYISMVVTPRDNKGLLGVADTSIWYYINAAPELQNLTVINRLHPGAIAVGEKVSADYDYFDKEGNPPGTHHFQWYRSNTGSWTSPTALPSQTDSTYTIQSADNNKFIAVEAYAYATAGSSPGDRTRSSWFAVGTLPSATISGRDTICNAGLTAQLTVTLTGENPPWKFKYTVNGANEDSVMGITQTVYTLAVTLPGTYVLTAVSDTKYAHGLVTGTGTVLLYTHPTAVFTDGATSCEHINNALRITLTGAARWTVSYRYESQTPVVISNILSSPLTVPVGNIGTYSLVSVSDKNCSGTASGSQEILPAPEVAISGLDTLYSIDLGKNDTVIVDPIGGNFLDSDFPQAIVPFGNTLIFYPSIAFGAFGSPFNLVYTYQDPSTSCVGKDSLKIYIIQESADIQVESERKSVYCFNDDPILIRGISLNGEVGTFSISSTPAGLVSAGNNLAYLLPSVIKSGTRTVTYTVTIDGVTKRIQKDFKFNEIFADFTWDNECFEEQSIVNFADQSVSSDNYDITGYKWNLHIGSNTITRYTAQTNYTFTNQVTYPIDLIVSVKHISTSTTTYCYDTIRKELILKPTFNVGLTAYNEDFEDAGDALWYSFSDVGSNSWTFGIPTGNVFNGADNAWYIDLTNLTNPEASYVESPCFNFTHSKRPMIKMNIWRDLIQNRDGVVLQYTTNNGDDWTKVGSSADIDGGKNWYNSADIYCSPGGQKFGWTNEQDPYWVEARHKLDNLVGNNKVRFRIAYGTDGVNIARDGIAFDNFWVGERTKKVLFEYFTNAGDANCVLPDQTLNSMLNEDENKNDIIDLQYHLGYPGSDPFYDISSDPSDSRESYYGPPSIPYGIMDGGYGNLLPASGYIVDFSSETLYQYDLTLAALDDNMFKFNLQTIKGSNSVDISIDLISNEVLPQKDLTLHTVIIENRVKGIIGENGETNFESVVKTMLPVNGTVFSHAWIVGQKEHVDLHYDYVNVFDDDELRVVVFVQNEDTKQVYQADIINPNIPTGIETHEEIQSEFSIYPNPASDLAYIRLDEPAQNRTQIAIINFNGSLVYNKEILPGQQLLQLPLNNFEPGMYIVRISNFRKLLGTEKLIHLGNK